jgi:hypothetical protein
VSNVDGPRWWREGSDQSTEVEGRLRAAWSKFGALNEGLLDVALSAGPLDEGSASALLRRLVGHIQFSGLQLAGDPARPALINTQYSPWNWGHSNPDTLYLSAVIDDQHDYRVFGILGTAAQTTFGVYTGKADQSHAVKVLAEDLEIAADGSFEVFFTREARGGANSCVLPEGATSFASYQTFSDWETQVKGTIQIECLNPGELPGPSSADDAIAAFEAHLDESRELFTMWVRDIPSNIFDTLPKNVALPPMQPPAAMAGAWFSPIPWELADGEALIIDYTIPEGSLYVGICLTNRWSEMIDIETRQTSLNLGQSHRDGNTVRVLLSATDDGVQNWLDTRGYGSGIVTWRATNPDAPAELTVTKIQAVEIDQHFDLNSRVTADQRAAAIAVRRRHFALRNTP